MNILIGYTGCSLVKNNFSLITPDFIDMGYAKRELGMMVTAECLSYELSKFVTNGSFKRSHVQTFMYICLILSATAVISMEGYAMLTYFVIIMFVISVIFSTRKTEKRRLLNHANNLKL